MSFLYSKLYDYQKLGCDWMISQEKKNHIIEDFLLSKGGILADEVGLGKTIMTLALIMKNPMKKTLLILPKSLVEQWCTQIHKFCQNKINVIMIDKDSKIKEQEGIFVMSQSLLNSKGSEIGVSPIHDVEWDRIIIDEAHSLRNGKSKYYQSCCLLKSPIKWALTATPIMNRMIDFVNIMSWIGINKSICTSEKDYICEHFILRRTKEDVKNSNSNLELPPCYVTVRHLSFSTEEEEHLYVKTHVKYRGQIMNSNNYIYMLENLLRIRQICIHPQLFFDGIAKKTNTVNNYNIPSTKLIELLNCIRNQPISDKCIVFCHFIDEIKLIAKHLSDNGYASVKLDGSMSIDERSEAVNIFKKDKNVNIFIIQINTGGQGINLQVANHIYMMAPNWNPALEHQAIGRCHRTGQRKPVHVTKFVISSGDQHYPYIEENIIKLQERKKKIIEQLLNDSISNEISCKTYASSLSKKDVRELFNIYSY